MVTFRGQAEHWAALSLHVWLDEPGQPPLRDKPRLAEGCQLAEETPEVCFVLFIATENGYARSHLLEENLIDFFVPFLPLEYHHVKLCARDAFLARGLPYTEAALDEVARMMVFVPKEEKLFSAQGCKSVSQRINYFLP